jgi:hypothetical protein
LFGFGDFGERDVAKADGAVFGFEVGEYVAGSFGTDALDDVLPGKGGGSKFEKALVDCVCVDMVSTREFSRAAWTGSAAFGEAALLVAVIEGSHGEEVRR